MSQFDYAASPQIRIIGNIGRVRTFYPDGRSYTFAGGAGLHLSLAVSEAGGLAAPIAVVGGDLDTVVSELEQRKVDMRAVRIVRSQPSCLFELSYDEAGSLVSAASNFHAAEALSQHALTQLNAPGHYHVSCRLPLDIEPVLAALTGKSFSLDFYSSSVASYLEAARPFLTQAAAVFVNQAEFVLMQEVVAISELELLMVSDGARDVRLFSHGDVIAAAQPPEVAALEMTGAGDTLAGTYLASTLAGAPVHESLRAAVRAASDATQRVDPLLGRS